MQMADPSPLKTPPRSSLRYDKKNFKSAVFGGQVGAFLIDLPSPRHARIFYRREHRNGKVKIEIVPDFVIIMEPKSLVMQLGI